MNFLRHTRALLLRVARSLGCDLSQTSPFSKNPFVDLRKLATTVARLGFDVGANEGQTACVVEMLFAPLYSGQAYFHEVYGFLTGFGYQVVGLDAIHRSLAGDILWRDALFRCQTA
jgi:hypothetical protein